MTIPSDKDLAILEQRARRLAAPLAADARSRRMLELVVFTLGGGRYGLETRHVREVTRLKEFTPTPGVPDFVMGLTSIRGEFLALIDLRPFLRLPTQGLSDLSYIIICGTDRAEFGILADTVHDVVTLDAEEIIPAPASLAGGAADHLRGVTREALAVLDGARLLADERLFVQQT